jgi:hypothetical protein
MLETIAWTVLLMGLGGAVIVVTSRRGNLYGLSSEDLMTPEAKVKAKIQKILKAHDVYFTMPIGTGFGSAGVPDFVVCHKGCFIGIEAKSGDNKPTALQLDHMKRIRERGGHTLVVNEDNYEELDSLLKGMK